METDYTDFAYQVKLPMHARSTASKAIKNNLRLTEVKDDQSLIKTAQKSQKIINDHIDHRRIERLQEPNRFDIKPSIGERCERKPAPPEKSSSEYDAEEVDKMAAEESGALGASVQEPPRREQSDMSLPGLTREPSVHFKEIQVNQMDKSNFYSMPIHGF